MKIDDELNTKRAKKKKTDCDLFLIRLRVKSHYTLWPDYINTIAPPPSTFPGYTNKVKIYMNKIHATDTKCAFVFVSRSG